MERNHGKWSAEIRVDELIREAFGLDEDRLMKDFLTAQTEIKDSQIPPEPGNGFAQLLGKINERGIESYNSKKQHEAECKDGSTHKIIHLRRTLKVALLVAVLGVILAAMGITAVANRRYLYTVKPGSDIGRDIIIRNIDTYEIKGTIEYTYDFIFEHLGINALRLGYLPQGMNYINTTLDDDQAIMRFEYNNKRFNIIHRSDLSSSMSNFRSDRDECGTVFNNQINQEIPIGETLTDSGETELNALIICDDTFYYLVGVMDESEFKKILSEVYIEE